VQGSIEESEGSWSYLLLARIADVLVGLEQRADVDSLSAPHRPVDGPVEGQLQGAPIQRAIYRGQRHHITEVEAAFTHRAEDMMGSLESRKGKR
jgi:hypothetical protein